jgi:hypothetical protein
VSETQRVVAAAAATETVVDVDGRNIEVKKLLRRESMKLMRLWGAASDVQVWLGNAIVAAHAKSIDGVPLPTPSTPDMAEANVERLGDAGIQAVVDWMAAARDEDALAAAKN